MKASTTLSFCFALSFLSGCEFEKNIHQDFGTVHAQVETTPVRSSGDAADDPAIWLHPSNPLQSLIIGTDKHFGLMVYDLSGNEVQALERGRLNNVDLRQGVLVKGERVTLATATNRSSKGLDIFQISNTGTVSLLQELPLAMEDPYGVCMHLNTQGFAHVFVNSKDAEYQQWLLNPGFELQPQLLNSFELESQPEGCAVDDLTETLYLGEEERGIWMLPLEQTGLGRSAMYLLDSVASPYLEADIEGMDIYRNGEEVYLVVSSQGNNSYALYDLQNAGAYLGSVRIVDNDEQGIDGVEETDGLAVSAAAFGLEYPQGLLVVQDGYNKGPTQNQNFKLLPWQFFKQAAAKPSLTTKP